MADHTGPDNSCMAPETAGSMTAIVSCVELMWQPSPQAGSSDAGTVAVALLATCQAALSGKFPLSGAHMLPVLIVHSTLSTTRAAC